MKDSLIKIDSLYKVLDIEPFILLIALLAVSWVFYKFFLTDVSLERHKNIQKHFKNLLRHFFVFLTLYSTFFILKQTDNHPEYSISRAVPYVAVVTYFWGLIVFVKCCRIIVLQYLFLGSMKHGVPMLLVNIFSLLLSIVLFFWTAANIFGLQVTPVLATSAAFSIILGLALQDTLGNLFAGISLQIDKTFEIGDWLEIATNSHKIVGQVKEITWRATILTGWTEELITVPNRMMANAQIANFTSSESPIFRSQVFKIHSESPISTAKQCCVDALRDISLVRKWPEPACIITESNENWTALKLIYSIDNYGSQFSVGDQVVESVLNNLSKQNIKIAAPRVELIEKSK